MGHTFLPCIVQNSANSIQKQNDWTIPQWADHIRRLINSQIECVPLNTDPSEQLEFINSFRDEYGNRRNTDEPFLAHLFGIKLPCPENMDSKPLDEQLWWIAHTPHPSAERAMSLIAPEGGMLPDQRLAIEYRTKVELCSLHACWVIASKAESDSMKTALRERCFEAAIWHTKELQPDNAIHRPWGTQVFIQLASKEIDQEQQFLAKLHAQTLVHNTCVTIGKPDILSAMILHDIVQDLER